MVLEPKDVSKQKKRQKEEASLQKRIANQWVEFSKTDAFKEFSDYMSMNQDMLLEYAQEMVMPSPVEDGKQVILSVEKSNSLLQNRRGIGIVKTYVESYINSQAYKNIKITEN